MPTNSANDIYASTLQVTLKQLLGLVVFYLPFNYLSKEVFGELNRTTAILFTDMVLAGPGREQIFRERIAFNESRIAAPGVNIFHTLIRSIEGVALLLVAHLAGTAFFKEQLLLGGIATALLPGCFQPFQANSTWKRELHVPAQFSIVLSMKEPVEVEAC